MSDSDILVGHLVADRYRIVRRLGAGGMGTVYVAVQEQLGREVALKVVRRELSGEKRALERFRREALSLSQAHHPHIVTLHDFGELPGGALWFAMELVRGENLRQRLVREGPLPLKKSVALVRDAASGLAAAHALGIVHRDLKPENILLMEAAGRPDFVKLVDFGVAKLPASFGDDERGLEKLTARGNVVGTPGYIAPEVALRDINDDPRSDLYALGVVWFECLTGRPPFVAQTATALLMMHAVDPPPPLPGDVPLPIAGLVQRLLAKAPEHRPASAEVLLALLDDLPSFDGGLVARSVAPPLSTPYAQTEHDSGHAELANAETAAPATAATPSAQTIASSSALTEGSLPVARPFPPTEIVRSPAPTEIVSRAPWRTPLLLGGALAALVVAGLVALGLGRAPGTHVDAGVPIGAVDAARDAGLEVARDAGVSRAETPADAGPRKKRHRKAPVGTPAEPGEYQPDLD